MPNILEFVRGLLTDAEEQEHFAENPQDYVTDRGFVDLSGEDVTEAIRRLAPTLPDGADSAARPQRGETELDAAVRELHFAVSLSPAISPADGDATEPEPEPEPEPDTVAEAAGDLEADRDPYAAFGDEMAAIVRNAHAQMQAAVARAENILREAQRDAEAIREEAQREAVEIVSTAERESSTMLAEARAKRDEILAAERELRKQLEGAQSVFQSLQPGDAGRGDNP